MANLKNFNFMSKSKFDEVETYDDEVYAVNVDSDLDYKKKVVSWGMPDYTAKYSAVNNQMYTLDYNCIVSIHNDNAHLYIYDKNGTNVYTGSCLNQYTQVHQYIVPVGYSFKCNQYGTIIPLNV